MDDFQTYRPLLFAIAYRMLGSASDAEDIVQETYLRYCATPASQIRSPKSYLSTIVTRLCLDELKSARVVRQFEVKDGPSTLYIGAQIAVEQTQGTAMLDSFLFVTVRGSNYFKIRYSTAAHDGSAGEAERFARAFAR